MRNTAPPPSSRKQEICAYRSSALALFVVLRLDQGNRFFLLLAYASRQTGWVGLWVPAVINGLAYSTRILPFLIVCHLFVAWLAALVPVNPYRR